MPAVVLPAVSGHRSLGVELLEALHVCADGAGAPDPLALQRQRGAVAGEAVAPAHLAGLTVLLVRVHWAGARKAGAGLLQVTLIGGLPTHYTSRLELNQPRFM